MFIVLDASHVKLLWYYWSLSGFSSTGRIKLLLSIIMLSLGFFYRQSMRTCWWRFPLLPSFYPRSSADMEETWTYITWHLLIQKCTGLLQAFLFHSSKYLACVQVCHKEKELYIRSLYSIMYHINYVLFMKVKGTSATGIKWCKSLTWCLNLVTIYNV